MFQNNLSIFGELDPEYYIQKYLKFYFESKIRYPGVWWNVVYFAFFIKTERKNLYRLPLLPLQKTKAFRTPSQSRGQTHNRRSLCPRPHLGSSHEIARRVPPGRGIGAWSDRSIEGLLSLHRSERSSKSMPVRCPIRPEGEGRARFDRKSSFVALAWFFLQWWTIYY